VCINLGGAVKIMPRESRESRRNFRRAASVESG